MITNRIKELMNALGMSVNSFSKRIGVTQATLNRYMLGSRKMSLATVEAILAAFDTLSAEWLLRGKGEMFVNNDANEKLVESILPLTQTISVLRDTIEKQQQTITELKNRLQ